MNLNEDIKRFKEIISVLESYRRQDTPKDPSDQIYEVETSDFDVSKVSSAYDFKSGGSEQFDEPVGFDVESLLGIKSAYNFDSEGGDIDVYEELEEQEDGSTGGDTTGDSASTNAGVSTWDSGVTRGKANPIDQNSKWDSGITRGKANPLT